MSLPTEPEQPEIYEQLIEINKKLHQIMHQAPSDAVSQKTKVGLKEFIYTESFFDYALTAITVIAMACIFIFG